MLISNVSIWAIAPFRKGRKTIKGVPHTNFAIRSNRMAKRHKHKKRLTLTELLGATSLVKTDLLTFDLTGITRDETGLT